MNDELRFRDRVVGAFLSDDGTFSIPKTARILGWTLTSAVLVTVAVGLAVLAWDWGDWQGFVITAASIWVGGGVADNVGHRLSYKSEADRRE